jgi:hypothetical protein
MVVNQIHIEGAAVLESEDDPPVTGQGHGPEAGQLSL